MSFVKTEEHLAQAEFNESFVSFIGDTSKYIGWKFVALHYSALHFGDAYIANKIGGGRVMIRNHDHRKELYDTHMDEDTFSSYERLESFSRKARYEPNKGHLLTVDLFEDLLTKDFPKLKTLSERF